MPYETYSKRQKRLSQSGQEDVFRYDVFPEEFRVQVAFIWSGAFGDAIYGREFWESIHNILSEEMGTDSLSDLRANTRERCIHFLKTADTIGVLDILELSFSIINSDLRNSYHLQEYLTRKLTTRKPDEAINTLNHRFREHNIGFEFLDGFLVRKDSEYLHETAIKPSLRLLNMAGFSGPQSEFLSAHEHMRHGQYQSAIVDANNAFESTMKTICDLRSWPYPAATAPASKLITIIFDNGLLPAFLTSHFDHLRGVLESGLPAVRNRMGGHGGGPLPADTPEYMAAYALHLTASNIVLLVEAHKAKF